MSDRLLILDLKGSAINDISGFQAVRCCISELTSIFSKRSSP